MIRTRRDHIAHIIYNTVFIGGMLGALLVLGGVIYTGDGPFHNDRPDTPRACFEDELAVWSGETNAHTTCISMDVLSDVQRDYLANQD